MEQKYEIPIKYYGTTDAMHSTITDIVCVCVSFCSLFLSLSQTSLRDSPTKLLFYICRFESFLVQGCYNRRGAYRLTKEKESSNVKEQKGRKEREISRKKEDFIT